MKRTILEHQAQNQQHQKRHKKGVIESKGGVCFEVDTRPFKGGP